MFNWGKKSKKTLFTTSEYLVMAANMTIAESKIDMAIPPWGGSRTAKEQNGYFKIKWSRADGYKIISKHQIKNKKGKAIALDICAWLNSKTNYNKERLIYIATLMNKNFEILKSQGKIPKNKYLHSGIFWKPDDKNEEGMGWDRAHHEIRDYLQTKIYV